MAKEKKLPHNTEAEKAVLGAMLCSKTLLQDGLGKLRVEDFYEENEKHRIIFQTMVNLDQRGEPIDPQTITNELINSKQLEASGGPDYLMELAEAVVTFENFGAYVKNVKDQALLRRFLTTIDTISKEYYAKDIGDVSLYLGECEKQITAVTDKRRVGDFQSAKDVTEQISKEIAVLKTATSDDSVTGTPTGYKGLNVLTHGFHPTELIILAARPGVGKTALALNLAYNAVMHGNHPVGYFSLEMPATMLFKRLVALDAGVSFDSLITGFGLNQNTRIKVQESCQRLASRKIYVDDTAGINLLDLVSKCRKLKNKEPDLGLIIVDYIGLVTTNAKTKSESRQLEIQNISQTLKKVALELEIPILAVAQLNRNVETRPGGEPQLSDLRESGSLEQDADIVLMLQETKLNEAENNPKNQLDKHNQEVEKAKEQAAKASGDCKLATLFVRKNRSGKQGQVHLLFKKDCCRFDSLSEEANRQVEDLDKERIGYLPTGD